MNHTVERKLIKVPEVALGCELSAGGRLLCHGSIEFVAGANLHTAYSNSGFVCASPFRLTWLVGPSHGAPFTAYGDCKISRSG
jgi:hypothetical protein